MSHAPEGIFTEVLLSDSEWVDISTRVRREGSGIRISRGRKNEHSRAIGTMNFTITDPSGDFNDLNPLSPYYERIGPNTQVRVSLGGTAPLRDAFGRVVSNGWTGGDFPWTLSGGTNPDDYDVNGKGLHSHPSTNVNHFSYTDLGQANHRVRAVINLSANLTGAGATSRVHARMTDTSNWYAAFLSYATSGAVTLRMSKTVAGVGTAFTNSVALGTFANYAATQLALEIYVEGARLYAKAWDISEPEPTGWMIRETDTDLTTGNNGGVSSRRETGNLEAGLIVAFDNFLAAPGSIRAHMEVPNLGAMRWTPGGKDVTMAIQAADLKRRLGAPGVMALQSPMTRFVSRVDHDPLVGYWTCEAGKFTGEIGSAVGGYPLNIVGSSIQFGSASPFPGIASVIQLGSGTSLMAASLPSADTGVVKGQICVKFPDDGVPDDTPIMQILTINDATVRKWYLRYQTSTGGALAIVGYDHSFSLVENSGYIGFNMNGKAALIQFEVRQSGADAIWEIATHEMQPDGTVESLSSTNTFPTTSIGAPSGVSVAPTGGMDGCLVAHVGVVNTATALDGAEVALTGHIGETTAERFVRLCDEEGISYEILGEAGEESTLRMGPQRTATLLQNFEDCEDCEHGVIYGARHFFGLAFRTHQTLLGQSDGPTFNYDDGYLTGEMFPNPDEASWGNDITASRPFGTEYRSVEETGPMSVQEPPNGIGRYPRPVQANTAWDAQLPDVARWNRHLGTWRGPRYPSIQFDTHRPIFTTALADSVESLEIGDPFTVDNQPAWLEPLNIKVLAQGYGETILNFEHTLIFNTVPAGPYDVAVRADGWYRDSAGSVMNSTAAAGATSLSVATATGPLWTTGAVDFNVLVSGSVLHVTNISGASSPQTFTVDAVRVNGIDKALPSGSEVHVFPRPVRALADENFNLTTHDDPAGTRVRGNDFPPAQWTAGETTGGFTSATYIEDTEKVGVVFMPPSTASFVVHIAGEMDNTDGTGSTFMSFIIRRGAVVGEGNVLVAADDTTAIMSEGTDLVRSARGFLFDVTTTELPPGVPINITLAHRRATAGTATIRRRMLLVRPVRTQGGLPGTLITAEPQAEDDVQDASDTSTSTSYTTTDMTTCGTAFVAGPSGKILVGVTARMDHSTNAPTNVGFEIREGAVVGSGTIFLGADDARSLSSQNVNRLYHGIIFGITGLTAGASYNVRLMHRTTSGTLTLENRNVYVEQVA